jgi:glycerol-3-phosphate dehydrogenase
MKNDYSNMASNLSQQGHEYRKLAKGYFDGFEIEKPLAPLFLQLHIAYTHLAIAAGGSLFDKNADEKKIDGLFIPIFNHLEKTYAEIAFQFEKIAKEDDARKEYLKCLEARYRRQSHMCRDEADFLGNRVMAEA